MDISDVKTFNLVFLRCRVTLPSGIYVSPLAGTFGINGSFILLQRMYIHTYIAIWSSVSGKYEPTSTSCFIRRSTLKAKNGL